MNSPENLEEALMAMTEIRSISDEFVLQFKNPTAADLIEFLLAEIEKAKEAKTTRSQEWLSMKMHAVKARAALDEGNIEVACFEFYALGHIDARLSHLSAADTEFLLKLASASFARSMSLQRINQSIQTTKTFIQKIALLAWKEDKSHRIRTAEMERLVRRLMDYVIKNLENESLRQETLVALPKPPTLKKWLREVAPEYAKKAGRPKNN